MEDKMDSLYRENVLDEYGEGLFRKMYEDPTVEWKSGNSVDDDGNLGWCDYKSGKKKVAFFDNVRNMYEGWKAKAFEYTGHLLRGAIYKHEKVEEEDKGRTDHAEMEIRKNLMRTRKGSDMALTEAALVDIGLEQGTGHAREVAEKSNISKIIDEYKTKYTKKFEMIKGCMEEYLGIAPIGKAFAAVEAD